MVVDALLAADAHLQLSDAIRDPRAFTLLDDTVLKRIEVSKEDELAAARAIVARIRTRDLYKYINEIIVPRDHALERSVTPADIVACQPHSGAVPGGIRAEDLVVQNLKIDWRARPPRRLQTRREACNTRR